MLECDCPIWGTPIQPVRLEWHSQQSTLWQTHVRELANKQKLAKQVDELSHLIINNLVADFVGNIAKYIKIKRTHVLFLILHRLFNKAMHAMHGNG